MEELQSLGLGLALGVLVVSALSCFPGEPFDYNTDRGIRRSSCNSVSSKSGSAAATTAHLFVLEQDRDDDATPADAASAAAMSPVIDPLAQSPASNSQQQQQQKQQQSNTTKEEDHHDHHRAREREVRSVQRRRVRELQALLGAEKHKMKELAARVDAAEGEAGDACASSSPSPPPLSSSFPSSASYSARLDAAFYVLTLAALVFVLRSEYGIDAQHVVARMFPREVETAANLLSAPIRLLQKFTW